MVKAVGLWSPVIVPLILSGLLLFSSERRNTPKLYLSGFMLLITFVFVANLFYFQHNYRVYSWFHSLHIATVLAIYPGAFVYIKLLIDPNRSARKMFRHFIPALLFLIASAVIFYPFLTETDRYYFLSEYRFNPDFSYPTLKILYYVRMANILVLFLQVLAYPVLTFFTLRKHKKHLKDLFSNPEKFQLNWLGLFNILLALSAFVSVFIYTVNPAKLFGDDRFLAYPLLVVAAILWFLGIMGNNQSAIPDYNGLKNDAEFDMQENASLGVLAEKLRVYFQTQKPYLDPELKIWDVSRDIGTNRTYVSHVINQSFHQNFSAFVNGFRLQETREILSADPDISLSELALKSGFGSVITLKRSFADAYHIKLSDYRQEVAKA